MKKRLLLTASLLIAVPLQPLHAAWLLADQTAYLNGETPLYTISGAPPGSRISWISVQNGKPTGEGDPSTGIGLNYNDPSQVVDGNGYWKGYGGTWDKSLDGTWTKIAVFDDGSTAGSNFVVVPKLTNSSRASSMSRMLGVATWQSHFKAGSSLQQGAKLVSEMGSKNIKIAMTPNALNPNASQRDYPGIDFGPATSLEELAQSASFRRIFSMPFENYDIDAIPLNGSPRIPLNLDTGRLERFDYNAVKKEMHDLAHYLLTTYHDSGKTFTLQDWEGDNVLIQNSLGGKVTQTQIDLMRQWEQARYDGVEEARQELNKITGVKVQVAIEFNSLDRARRNQLSMLKDVIPFVDSDLVSYSSYDSIYRSPTDQLTRLIQNDMAFIHGYTKKEIMIGEFGESSDPKVNPFAGDLPERIQLESQAFAQSGVQNAYYWQIVDTAVNGDAGYGLINQDGTPELGYETMKNLLQDGSSVASSALSPHTQGMIPARPRNTSLPAGRPSVTSPSAPNLYKRPSVIPGRSVVGHLTAQDLQSSSVQGPFATHQGTVINNR